MNAAAPRRAGAADTDGNVISLVGGTTRNVAEKKKFFLTVPHCNARRILSFGRRSLGTRESFEKISNARIFR